MRPSQPPATSLAKFTKKMGKAYLFALIITFACLIAAAVSFGYHLRALGIVFAVLFGIGLLAALTSALLLVRRNNAAVEQLVRENAAEKARYLDG